MDRPGGAGPRISRWGVEETNPPAGDQPAPETQRRRRSVGAHLV